MIFVVLVFSSLTLIQYVVQKKNSDSVLYRVNSQERSYNVDDLLTILQETRKCRAIIFYNINPKELNP